MKKHKKLVIIIVASFLVLFMVVVLCFAFFKPLAQTTAPISQGKHVSQTLCPGTGIYVGGYPTYQASRDFHILKGEKDNYDQAIKDAANPNYSYYYNCWAYPVRYRLFL